MYVSGVTITTDKTYRKGTGERIEESNTGKI